MAHDRQKMERGSLHGVAVRAFGRTVGHSPKRGDSLLQFVLDRGANEDGPSGCSAAASHFIAKYDPGRGELYA